MDEARLIEAAFQVRANAYAPYSEYRVGAAVMDDQGRVFAGCNVENVSYGLCLCAERSAVSRMVAEGGKRIQAVAVATKDGGTPCGMCRQTLVEFAGDPESTKVFCANENGTVRSYVLSELMPNAFQSDTVGRTSDGPEGSK